MDFILDDQTKKTSRGWLFSMCHLCRMHLGRLNGDPFPGHKLPKIAI